MKKVFVGSIRQETNSFSPVKTVLADFAVFQGEEMLDKIAAAPIFREAGIEVIPSISAYALPSGKVDEKCFNFLTDRLVGSIPEGSDVDGIWLYLHGAMEVENKGSAEAILLSEVRKKVGPGIPVAVALDFHANNTETLVKLANIVYGYRTAPHEDEEETQIRTAELLVDCMRSNILPVCTMVRVPVLLPGEMLTTGVEPTRTLMKELDIIDKRADVLCASVFGGMPWADTPNSGASVVVVGREGSPNICGEAERLAQMFWSFREKFHCEAETADPKEALERAAGAKEGLVFVSDSGDNVTAGAAGDNAYLLNLILDKRMKRVLVAGITDSRVIGLLKQNHMGEKVKLHIGAEMDASGSAAEVVGILVSKRKVLDECSGKYIDTAVIRTCGIDIIITEGRCAFVSPRMMEAAGIKLSEYRIIVVKLGYLYPGLREISQRSILALTPGSSSLDVAKLKYEHIRRPVYPLDKYPAT